MERWGSGWDVCTRSTPLIMVRISATGRPGPYRDRPGFGRIGNAFGGLSFLAGHPDRAPVTRAPRRSLTTWRGFTVRLARAGNAGGQKTNEGQFIDIGLYEADLSHP